MMPKGAPAKLFLNGMVFLFHPVYMMARHQDRRSDDDHEQYNYYEPI